MKDGHDNRTFTWYVCSRCATKIVEDTQEHERVIVRNPAYASGECSVCRGVIRFKVIVQKNTENWLKKFTFNREYNMRVHGEYFLDKH